MFIMFDLLEAFKEIIVESTQTDKWNVIRYDLAGRTASILQDIKVTPHFGGCAFTGISNRFIYWRANHDVLEIIDLSLDINLSDNQLRFQFKNAPILKDITIHERGSVVVMLVATVSCLIRLEFSHPSFEKSNESRTSSIFSDLSLKSSNNRKTHCSINTLPNLPLTATSALTSDDNAIFCVALNNNSILVVRFQHLTGMTTYHYLEHEIESCGFLSDHTRLLSGKSGRSGKPVEDYNTVSMVLERHHQDLYLFALNRAGQLKAWCCSKLKCVCEYDFSIHGRLSPLVQNHILRTEWNGRSLILGAYCSFEDAFQLIVLHARFKDDGVVIDSEPHVYILPNNSDLIEMSIECGGKVIWCILRSIDPIQYTDPVQYTLSTLSTDSGKWTVSILQDDKTSILDNISHLGITPQERYLNLIFYPGAFSLEEIAKISREIDFQHDIPSTKLEFKFQICTTVERCIRIRASKYKLADEANVDYCKRIWELLYSTGVMYQKFDKKPRNLFRLPSAKLLVAISKTNLSFYRAVDVLEESLIAHNSNESQCYKHLMKIISNVKLSDEQKLKFNQAVHGFYPLTDVLEEVAAELENDLNFEINDLMKSHDLHAAFKRLSDILFMPETFKLAGNYCDSFRGELGSKITYSVIYQIVRIRLDTCRNLALLLQILDSSELKRDFLALTMNQCRAYSVLNWCCESVIRDHPQLISLMQSILSTPQITMQPLLLDSVWSILQYLWPLTNSVNLAEYLFTEKHYHLLQYYSRLVDSKTWTTILIRCYLETNEPYKASDIVEQVANTPEEFLKMISLFELADQSDIVIHLTELAINVAEKTEHPDLPILYSILFSHHLKLGHYHLAFVNLNKNPDKSRQVNCLRELVTTLMNAGRIDTLLNLPYNDSLPPLKTIMEQYARLLQPQEIFV